MAIKLLSVHLEISNGSIEGVVAEAAFFVEELSRLTVDWRAEQTIVEALF